MKKFLEVTVFESNGNQFSNPLKLSEAHLVSQMAQNASKLEVKCVEVSKEHFKSLFG